jgi:hypothetical protein
MKRRHRRKVLTLILILVFPLVANGNVLLMGSNATGASGSATVITFRDDHIMLVNGDPFFPLGIWYGYEYRDGPWNCLNSYTLKPSQINSTFHGSKYFILGEYLFEKYYDDEQKYREYITGINNSQFLAWYSADEALWRWEHEHPAGWPQYQDIKNLYDKLKRDDPFHPVWFADSAADMTDNLSQYIAKRQRWMDTCDVIGCNIYPTWGPGSGDDQCKPGSPWCVIEKADEDPYLSAVADMGTIWLRDIGRNQKPVWMIAQAWGDVSEKEIRFQIWQCVIHGVTGIIFWWVHGTPQGFWDLNAEGAENAISEAMNLHDVLVARSYEAEVTSTPGVETLVKKVDEDYYIISVYRKTTSNVTAQFNVSALGIDNKTAVLVNENQTVEVLNGKFMLAYEPFDTHIILFTADKSEPTTSTPGFDSCIYLVALGIAGFVVMLIFKKRTSVK